MLLERLLVLAGIGVAVVGHMDDNLHLVMLGYTGFLAGLIVLIVESAFIRLAVRVAEIMDKDKQS